MLTTVTEILSEVRTYVDSMDDRPIADLLYRRLNKDDEMAVLYSLNAFILDVAPVVDIAKMVGDPNGEMSGPIGFYDFFLDLIVNRVDRQAISEIDSAYEERVANARK